MQGMAVLVLLVACSGLGVASAGAPQGSWRGGSWGGSSGGPRQPNGYYFPSQYSCKSRGCFTPSPNPTPTTAWDYISTNPELTFLTTILRGTTWQAILDRPTDMTVLAPTDAAFDDYFFNQFSPALLTNLGNDAERKGITWQQVLKTFFPRLVQYFLLPEPVFAKDLQAGKWMDTVYSSPNARPHKVYFGSKTVPIVYAETTNKYAKPCRTCKSLAFYLMDEQKKSVTIKTADKFVEGGGVVHVINGILQPNDIYPSILAAQKGTNITALVELVDSVKDSAWGRNAWGATESSIATLIPPNNEAVANWIASMGGQAPPAPLLYSIVRFGNCPVVGPDTSLLYTPFPTNNPCLTGLGRGSSNTALSLLFKAVGNDKYTVQGLTGGPVANILMPDISTPLSVMHITDTYLAPPIPGPGK